MGRPSRIKQLPPDILEQLHALLRDPRVTQLEVVASINALLQERGEAPVSKSALNRYKLRMDEAGAAMRDAREMAEIWIAKLGAAPQGQVGQLINEIIRVLALDVSLEIKRLVHGGTVDEERLPEVVRMLKQLAEALEKLERAASDNERRAAQIREQARREAAEMAEAAAQKAGVSADGIAALRAAILQELSA
jgi:hypothetical protein